MPKEDLLIDKTFDHCLFLLGSTFKITPLNRILYDSYKRNMGVLL
jgi:hypothetical protein